MATLSKRNKSDRSNGSAKYQSVNIFVDPKTRNLDTTMRDILQISAVIAEHMPSATLRSIKINDYFAVVKAAVPNKHKVEELTLRLYEVNGVWRIRGCAFEQDTAQSHKVLETSHTTV